MNSEKSVAAVVGGAGFIGRFIIEQLKARGDEVHSIDLIPASNDLLPSDRSHQVDIRDVETLRQVLADIRPRAVYHLAANADIRLKEAELATTNVDGTRNLIKTLPESVTSVLFASTQLVVTMGVDPGDGTVLAPYTDYGHTKANMERLIRSECNIPWVIVRPTTIWGPYHPTFANSIWKYLEKGYYLHPVTKRPIIRSYGYVENTAQQMISLLDMTPGAAEGRVFYVTDNPLDSGAYLDALSLALRGKSVRRVPAGILRSMSMAGGWLQNLGINAPLDMGRYTRMTSDYIVPYEPTFALTGPPTIGLDDGVQRTATWYRARRR